MIFRERPADFAPRFEVGSCFIESDGEILLLLRQPQKPQGGTWGVPAGKVRGNVKEETLREITEETGIALELNDLEEHGTVFVRYPEYDFVYHMYRTVVSARPAVVTNPTEHQAADWVRPDLASARKLMEDLDWCIAEVYGEMHA